MANYDWPPLDGLVAFVQEHGATNAARRLGVPITTLRSHLHSHGLTAEDYAPRKTLNADALKEIADLCR